MTIEKARVSIGQQVCNVKGMSQANGRFLPAGSTFLLEFVNGVSFGLSWQSPRGKLTLELPNAVLSQFVSRADWLR